ncbi:MAG: hypothetical protein PVH61_02025 [Candidatus Aminicenantes bacterium]|jgi:hypothetical protein
MGENISVNSVNSKKKLIFPAASAAALLIIFFIYSTYTQKYVGGSDFYGYYAQSLLLKKGQVDMPVGIPPAEYPAIAPLSYFVNDGKVLPQYPPGYPLLMALAGFIGLEFYVTPILGILSIVLMYLLIKELTDKKIAVFFSLIWAFFPIVVYGSTSVMSDLVAAFFILLALYLYQKGKIPLSAFSLAFSLVVRPTNILFCLIFLPVLIRDRQWFKFGSYFAIPAFFYGLYNWLVYGAPWKIGYANVSERFITSAFFHHLGYYARETVIQFTPFLIIFIFFHLLLIAYKSLQKKQAFEVTPMQERHQADRETAGVADPFEMTPRKNGIRLTVNGLGVPPPKEWWFYVSWFLIFFIFYCFWRPLGGTWWWTRFLLPGYPALFFLSALGLKNVLDFIQQKWKPAKHTVTISLAAIALIIIAYYINYGFTHPDIWEKNKGKHYYDISKMMARKVPDNSLVGSVEFSGPLRLYTGIETFNSFHTHSFFLIADMLEKKKPVYFAAEPWNLQRPMVKGVFRIFRVKKVMEITGWPDFYLYKIQSRRKRAWKLMLRRLAAKESKEESK